MLVRCLYASRPVAPHTGPVLDDILEHSRKKNPRLGITGLLCVSDNLFIQVIDPEGVNLAHRYHAHWDEHLPVDAVAGRQIQ